MSKHDIKDVIALFEFRYMPRLFMIQLYQGPRAFGQPNLSPFCTKVELFLRCYSIEYRVRGWSPVGAPRGKMPYIENKGSKIGDSQLILDHLQHEFGLDIDSHLSCEQRALGHCIRKLLEESSYFYGLFLRWSSDANFAVIKPIVFGSLPWPMKWIIPRMVRRRMMKSLHGQGTGRHCKSDIVRMLEQDLSAVAALQKNKPYFFGERISSVDFTFYSFCLAMMADLPEPVPVPKDLAMRLKTYCDPITQLYFPEFAGSCWGEGGAQNSLGDQLAS